MSSNKRVKEEMIKRYGAECFIDRLHLRKDDDKPKRYKGKGQYKRMKMLTYHHIRMKSKGGKATVENGALLSAENHAWFHQQDRNDQERMNQMFQDLKRDIDHGLTESVPVVIVPDEQIEQPFEIDALVINPDKDGIKIQSKVQKKKKYNRAKQKRKTEKMVKRYYKNRGRNDER